MTGFMRRSARTGIVPNPAPFTTERERVSDLNVMGQMLRLAVQEVDWTLSVDCAFNCMHLPHCQILTFTHPQVWHLVPSSEPATVCRHPLIHIPSDHPTPWGHTERGAIMTRLTDLPAPLQASIFRYLSLRSIMCVTTRLCQNVHDAGQSSARLCSSHLRITRRSQAQLVALSQQQRHAVKQLLGVVTTLSVVTTYEAGVERVDARDVEVYSEFFRTLSSFSMRSVVSLYIGDPHPAIDPSNRIRDWNPVHPAVLRFPRPSWQRALGCFLDLLRSEPGCFPS